MRLATLFLLVLLGGCQHRLQPSVDALSHQPWQLVTINGQPVSPDLQVTLTIVPSLQVHGYSGCNRFFGQGQWRQGRFTLPSLGMTRMACPPRQSWIESAVIGALREGVTLELAATSLTLRSSRYTLHYLPITVTAPVARRPV